MNSAANLWQSYVQAVGAVDKGVNNLLGLWGRVVAKRPVLTLVLSTSLALATSSGVTLIGDRFETESDKLWVPRDSIWIKQEKYLESRFGITDREVALIFEGKAGGNVLTTDSIREMFMIYETVNRITTEEDGISFSFQSGICWKSATGACHSRGILLYFNNSAAEFEQVAAQGDAAVMQALSAPTYPDGTVATAEGTFMGAERDSHGVLVSATAAYWVHTPQLHNE